MDPLLNLQLVVVEVEGELSHGHKLPTGRRAYGKFKSLKAHGG
jgi:hypothetical protein